MMAQRQQGQMNALDPGDANSDAGLQNRNSYGGYVGGATDAANRYQGMGAAGDQRQAYQPNYGGFQYGQSQAQQGMQEQQQAQDLNIAAARGQAPSQAEIAGKAAMDRSLANQVSAAGSARGGPTAVAAANRNAARTNAGNEAQMQANIQAGRAQEMAQARAQATTGAEGITKSGLGYGQNALGQTGQESANELAQRQLNQQNEQYYEGLANNVNDVQLAANQSAQQEADSRQNANAQRSAESSNFGWGKVMDVAQMAGKGVGAVGGAAASGGAAPAAAAAAARGGPIYPREEGGEVKGVDVVSGGGAAKEGIGPGHGAPAPSTWGTGTARPSAEDEQRQAETNRMRGDIEQSLNYKYGGKAAEEQGKRDRGIIEADKRARATGLYDNAKQTREEKLALLNAQYNQGVEQQQAPAAAPTAPPHQAAPADPGGPGKPGGFWRGFSGFAQGLNNGPGIFGGGRPSAQYNPYAYGARARGGPVEPRFFGGSMAGAQVDPSRPGGANRGELGEEGVSGLVSGTIGHENAVVQGAMHQNGMPSADARGGAQDDGGVYLVGEEGPELVVPKDKGWVMTAQQTAALLGAPPTTQQKAGMRDMGMSYGNARPRAGGGGVERQPRAFLDDSFQDAPPQDTGGAKLSGESPKFAVREAPPPSPPPAPAHPAAPKQAERAMTHEEMSREADRMLAATQAQKEAALQQGPSVTGNADWLDQYMAGQREEGGPVSEQHGVFENFRDNVNHGIDRVASTAARVPEAAHAGYRAARDVFKRDEGGEMSGTAEGVAKRAGEKVQGRVNADEDAPTPEPKPDLTKEFPRKVETGHHRVLDVYDTSGAKNPTTQSYPYKRVGPTAAREEGGPVEEKGSWLEHVGKKITEATGGEEARNRRADAVQDFRVKANDAVNNYTRKGYEHLPEFMKPAAMSYFRNMEHLTGYSHPRALGGLVRPSPGRAPMRYGHGR
jgi:hypothetical protein